MPGSPVTTTAANTDTRYLRAIKTALTGDPDTRLVLLCNFEVEQQWARGHIGLPDPGFAVSAPLVQRMEELGALLAGPDDFLILRTPLDPGYRAYAESAGTALPTQLVPENGAEAQSTAEAVLASPQLLRRLSELGREGARLLPMGVSALEQRVAEVCGLPLAVPDAATCERVNSKIYGRRLVEAAGLRPVPGQCCETVAEFAAALTRRAAALEAGSPVVVKDAFGVSGKGLVLLESPVRARRLLTMVQRRAERRGDDRLEVVVEDWLPKAFDLNYQVVVDRDGRVELDFVKGALTENGVHRGHVMPPDLDAGHLAEIGQAAQAVGAALYADGFTGVAGIDAILGANGLLYPVLEINARLNMSTYQGSVTERFLPPESTALAKHYTLALTAPLTFEAVRSALGPVADLDGPGPADGRRLVITCFGTVNAAADTAAANASSFQGRLHTLLIAPDRAGLAALDTTVQAALSQLSDVRPTSETTALNRKEQ
ncbi:ATP-grasp domain-containing protein [Catenulispora sp. NL8]|uniref:ATP-grasp domain-containing protein n=1 Tax=Catenulispora pinistramenti TaxID=2705254 RepID=A0ABS5KPF4_9ACTN|nr:ATP-grasp domain-containing protein [Catenulispora pinistramenti]MBS2547869.1 ATP-grasp domain-containing protein [Catenulispora pinistramenti]